MTQRLTPVEAEQFISSLKQTILECEIAFTNKSQNQLYILKDRLKTDLPKANENEPLCSEIQKRIEPQVPFKKILDILAQYEYFIIKMLPTVRPR